MKLLHIVRRYGPVGGMERYVWELTLQLRDMGVPVTVICQRCYADLPAGINVIELGDVAVRPRWIAALRFSHRVTAWLKQHPQTDTIIHSHERVQVHQATTMHGPPFANVRDKPWWKRASIRVAMQFYLERRELRCARVIVPNSEIIKEQLTHYYPEYAHKLTQPIVPGVQAGQQRAARLVPADGGVVGFVGHEWKRKGLPFAVKIVEKLRETRPQLRFVVMGPEPSAVQALFAAWQGGFELLGWRKEARYADFDVLLHPALAEPYGMVIAEAMAARVPVVISNLCGAKVQVTASAGGSSSTLAGDSAGEVLSLDAPVQAWAAAVTRQLERSTQPAVFVRGWDVVAQESMALYDSLKTST